MRKDLFQVERDRAQGIGRAATGVELDRAPAKIDRNTVGRDGGFRGAVEREEEGFDPGPSGIEIARQPIGRIR